MLGRELADEGAEPLREREVGTQQLEQLARDRRDVHRVANGARAEEVDELLRERERHRGLRLLGGGAEVRGADEVRLREERVVRGRRLDREDVQRRAAELAAVERAGERRLVDEAAAGAVDEASALLHERELPLADEVLRLIGEGHMERHEVRPAQHVVEGQQLDSEPRRRLGRDEGVEADDLHLERERPLDHHRADVARADDPERLARELVAGREALLLPLAGLHRRRGRRDLPREREHHRDRQLGHRDRASARRVHHHDAAPAGRREVDVVDPHARPPDDLQPLARLEDLRRDLGRAADREPVVLPDDREELRRLEPDLDVHLQPRGPAQHGQPLLGQLIGDEQLHRRSPWRTRWPSEPPSTGVGVDS